MKKYNQIFAGTMISYIIIVLLFLFNFLKTEENYDREYLVEVNRVMNKLQEKGRFEQPELDDYKSIVSVSFLPNKAVDSKLDDKDDLLEFYEIRNDCDIHIVPLISNNRLLGYIRFDYQNKKDKNFLFMLLILIFAFIGMCIFLLLLYIKWEILKPFFQFSDIPYQISKGHLKSDIQENKNHFFGRFLWGISMLQDTLSDAKMKELKLQKEKKLLLLSISHDIKTPVNTIRLYAKALEQNLYISEEEKKQAANSIQNQANKIDDFVKEIMRTSREEILTIEVVNTEFYLGDLVHMIQEHFEPKCKLKQIDFIINNFDNKLLKGDLDKTFEVVENLMENAFKYGDGKQINISFSEEEYCQLIHIDNTGIPVKEIEMIHLFDSFFRGSNVENKTGNGLGLYICKEIMKKMEGDIYSIRKEDGMSFVLVIRE